MLLTFHSFQVMMSERYLVAASYGDIDAHNSLWLWDMDPPPPQSDAPSWGGSFDAPKQPPKHDRTMKGHSNTVSGIIKLDRGQVLSYSQDSSIRLWSMRTLACKLVFKHSGPVTCVKQLQYGKHRGLLVSCSWDQTVKLWPNPKHHT